MPKKVAEFLKSLLTKSGINLEDEAIKTAIAAVNQDIEVPDEIATAIDNGLLSLASAKNNHPDIKGHYYAAAYDGLDKELDALMEAEKLPDELRRDIKQEKSSTKRAVLLTQKIKDLTAQKANANKGDKEELNRQIAELNTQLREIKDKEQAIHADYKNQLRQKDMGYALRGILGTYKTVYDEMDASTKDIVLDAIIKKNLNARNAEFTIDQNGNLVLQTKDGSNLFSDDHRPLNPKMFLDQVLASEKALKVTDTGNANNNFGPNNGRQNNSGHANGANFHNNQNQNNSGNGNNGGGKKNPVLASLVNESLAALEKSNGSGGF